ncbi:MAG: LamG domain-containing protein, partial [Candidatus Shapirobacteria bacterium]|nr:LamG domain-containing protein [Candidatus Shapirobacteria bacterium]
GGIISKYDIHGYYVYRLFINSDGTISFNGGYDGVWTTTLTSLSSVNDDNWHNISAVFDSQNMYIFIDGQLDNSVSETRASKYTNAWHDFCIGTDRYDCVSVTSGGNDYFAGLIDQVKIYDYARTPAQIAWDYNRGAPVGHWRFDECQGTTAYDVSGNDNHGTINIGASTPQTSAGTCTSGNSAHAWYNGQEGRINSAMNFDGVDDYSLVNDNTILDIENDKLTVGAWVYRKGNGASTAGYILSKSDNAATNHQYGLYYQNTGAFCYMIMNSANACFSNSSIVDNQWHHVAMTYDRSSSQIKLFINGQLKDTGTVNNDIVGTSSNVYIGCRGNSPPSTNHHFNGLIDDVRIYNYALTDDQIKTLYNDGVAVRF